MKEQFGLCRAPRWIPEIDHADRVRLSTVTVNSMLEPISEAGISDDLPAPLLSRDNDISLSAARGTLL